MDEEVYEKEGVDYSHLRDLARREVLEKIKSMAQDRMVQGEVLDEEGMFSWLEDGEEFDNAVFTAYESYLNYIHYIVQNTPIPLHV